MSAPNSILRLLARKSQPLTRAEIVSQVVGFPERAIDAGLHALAKKRHIERRGKSRQYTYAITQSGQAKLANILPPVEHLTVVSSPPKSKHARGVEAVNKESSLAIEVLNTAPAPKLIAKLEERHSTHVAREFGIGAGFGTPCLPQGEVIDSAVKAASAELKARLIELLKAADGLALDEVVRECGPNFTRKQVVAIMSEGLNDGWIRPESEEGESFYYYQDAPPKSGGVNAPSMPLSAMQRLDQIEADLRDLSAGASSFDVLHELSTAGLAVQRARHLLQ